MSVTQSVEIYTVQCCAAIPMHQTGNQEVEGPDIAFIYSLSLAQGAGPYTYFHTRESSPHGIPYLDETPVDKHWRLIARQEASLTGQHCEWNAFPVFRLLPVGGM